MHQARDEEEADVIDVCVLDKSQTILRQDGHNRIADLRKIRIAALKMRISLVQAGILHLRLRRH